ncbi:hypothetical protein HDU86_004621 [Geranomyces michiganensis]|nr:hypothetical protein HDU86_004621 [Geranomyces michiganensis]
MSRRVIGGGSFLVGWRLVNKHVLIVGGGKEASGRVFFALDADARCTIVCPRDGLNDDVANRIANGELAHIDRNFEDADLNDVDMVLSCIDDHEESRRIATLCRKRRIPVNCADIPELCDFYFFAQGRRGPVQFGVSTNGCGPRVAARLRDIVDSALPAQTQAAVERMGTLRRRVREQDPGSESSTRRMTWLSRLSDTWSFEEMAAMDDGEVLKVLEAYERGDEVPPATRGTRRATALSQKPGAIAASGSAPRRGWFSQDPATTPNSLTDLISRSYHLPLFDLTSRIELVTKYTTSTALAVAEQAQSITSHALDIGTTYAGALTATGSSYVSHAKTTAEDVVETGLRTLPQPVSHALRTGLNYIPLLPIHVSARPKGRLTLAGAGPGDPGLLTVHALNALQNADLVVSDQLVPKPITDLVRPSRLHLVKRKAAGQSDASQDDANETCLAALERGLDVVRLKGGDPFLFGRGGEEIAFFRSKGHEPHAVIPGISSCIAAPASALIPVTHRGAADQVLVLSGRGEGGSFPRIPPHDDKRTTVILMSVGRLNELVGVMTASGYPADFPAAVVEKGCWGKDQERVVRGCLGNIFERVTKAKVGAPALLVVGNTVRVLQGPLPQELLVNGEHKMELD